ncbi:MAG: cytochrome c3 family protein [Proteobacteria bacterium]|nr:cytochrome c3 family protein [Pseudomonadota bacterium]
MITKLLTGALIICLFCSCSFFCRPAKIRTGPEVITFEADLGPVLFQHRKHQHELKQNCVICHHKGSEKTHACRSCHKKKKDTVEGDPICFFDVKMSLCRDCHQKERDQETSKKAPIHCNECHDTKKIKWTK